jgi:hypothetical protein
MRIGCPKVQNTFVITNFILNKFTANKKALLGFHRLIFIINSLTHFDKRYERLTHLQTFLSIFVYH